MTTSSSEFEINLTSENMADDSYVKRILVDTKLKVLQEIANATGTDLNTMVKDMCPEVYAPGYNDLITKYKLSVPKDTKTKPSVKVKAPKKPKLVKKKKSSTETTSKLESKEPETVTSPTTSPQEPEAVASPTTSPQESKEPESVSSPPSSPQESKEPEAVSSPPSSSQESVVQKDATPPSTPKVKKAKKTLTKKPKKTLKPRKKKTEETNE